MTGPDDRWPDLAGALTGEGHLLAVRVYYEDTDFSGVVYHASYLRFMERGRSDFLRLCGIHHNQLDAGLAGERLAFAVRHMDIDFLKPARIDDVLEVHTVCEQARGARLVLAQEVRRGAEVLIKARVTAAVINAEGKPRRMPKDLAARLQQ
ncbi:tol-pal system-associated acyl-CoA thioesterase [Breoghania sp. L-A4]|uniref:tol-pal system-associated acyl-CoA thioesterase n=1 Tax=Breoghania sp. L-A4 TaxID=2304600 RepID=UPI000E359D6F|nr:tol-pal system-associated acyl-CoA thioesterase [Breoghania sp. L-A4]AXS41795.1 tol-pal system-associated acyl-CoA thioesterase [Breoghania sp. L-A4]